MCTYDLTPVHISRCCRRCILYGAELWLVDARSRDGGLFVVVLLTYFTDRRRRLRANIQLFVINCIQLKLTKSFIFLSTERRATVFVCNIWWRHAGGVARVRLRGGCRITVRGIGSGEGVVSILGVVVLPKRKIWKIFCENDLVHCFTTIILPFLPRDAL